MLRIASAALLGLVFLPSSGQPTETSGDEIFEKEIRPLLIKRCYKCHSEGKKQEANLLLDRRSGWAKGGDSGPAIVPGKPDDSLLIDAVRYDGDATPMPPDSKLPEIEIAALVKWVAMGAPDPRTGEHPVGKERAIDMAEARKFWSFRPLTQVTLPHVQNNGWRRTAVDPFIQSAMEKKEVKPAPDAEKRILIRRAYLDLLGLPPTTEEIVSFEADTAPDAYERLINRLLASPRYGERWGRHWLDLARFAESHGFEHDTDRETAYHYRDFVIEALNRDLPYDEFVKWQIAGDEFEPENNLALKATGFLAAGVHSTQITKNEVEKHRYDELDDILNTIGTSMLGLTLGCARCHDHKFDPVAATDYYRMLATFTTTVRSEVDLYIDRAGDHERMAAFEKTLAPFAEAKRQYEQHVLPVAFSAWEGARPAGERSTWIALERVETKSANGATLTLQPDGSILASGKNPESDTYTLTARTKRAGIRALRIEALAHPSFVNGGPGRAANGNFALSDLRATVKRAGDNGPARAIKFVKPRATFEQGGLPIAAAIDADKKSGWAIDPQFGKDQAAVFELEQALPDGELELTFTLDFQTNTGHGLGRFRLSVSSSAGAVPLVGSAVPAPIANLLDRREQRNAEDSVKLLGWYKSIDPGWQALCRTQDEHAARAPKPMTVKALISSEGLPPVRLHSQGDDFLPVTHILSRGDPNLKLGIANQGFLDVLNLASEREKHWQQAPPKEWRTSYRRRALADWITDTQYGGGSLLARVIVNRMWQHHFGKGIVATPSDFGSRGEKPTHPELLDWLAGELIRGGWRLKPMHRLLMTSSVYRENAAHSDASASIDPTNNLYWRRERRRLEAESIRDSLLAVGGRLDERMYGPGTLDESSRRRSIYFTVKRSKLIPILHVFDAPDGLSPLGERPTTTIAPQALAMMNNATVRESAAGFAARLLSGTTKDWGGIVDRGFEEALGRSPTAAERADAVDFLKQQEASYHASAQDAAKQMALADFCQTLFALNEFIYAE